MQNDANRAVTKGDVVLTVATLSVLLIPLIVLTAFSEVRLIQTLLGGGRIFLFWAVVALAVFVNRRKIDEWLDKRYGSPSRRAER